MVQDLPDGYFVVGDKVYILSSNLIIPYSGKDKQDASKVAFIFFIPALNPN
jgi:hypothetical protein